MAGKKLLDMALDKARAASTKKPPAVAAEAVGRSVQSPMRSATFDELSEAIKQNPLYVRWSRGPEFDLNPSANSRDYVSGETHEGLSSVGMKGEYSTNELMRILNDYSATRLKDDKIRPHLYEGKVLGKDSDGADLIRPSRYVGTVADELISFMDDPSNIKRLEQMNIIQQMRPGIDNASTPWLRDWTRKSVEQSEAELGKLGGPVDLPAAQFLLAETKKSHGGLLREHHAGGKRVGMDNDMIERALRLARGGYADGGDAEVQSNGMPVISNGQVNWGDSDSAADFFRADQAMRAMRTAPAAPEPQAAPRVEPRRAPPVYSAPRDVPRDAPSDVPLPPVRPAYLDRPYEPEGPFGALDMSSMQPAPVPSVSMGYRDVSPLFEASTAKAPSFGAMENITPGASDWRRGSLPQEGGGKYTNRAMPLTPPAPPAPTTDELLALLSSPTQSAASAAIDQAAPVAKFTDRAAPGISMTPQQRDLIIRTIAAESSGKTPEEGQGIANVIMNRIMSGRYGKTPERVLFAPKQFEPWADPRGSNYPMRHKPGSTKYEKAQAALDAAMGGDDITGGATHFWGPKTQAALGRPAPKWGRTGGLDIGETRFHRDDGGMVEEREGHAGGKRVVSTALEALRARAIPRVNPTEAADRVAFLLRNGRGNEVTNDLAGAADPNTLLQHYLSGGTGTEMPMAQAARIGRAKEMGYHTEKPYYHAGDPKTAFDNSRGELYVTTDKPFAEAYRADKDYGDVRSLLSRHQNTIEGDDVIDFFHNKVSSLDPSGVNLKYGWQAFNPDHLAAAGGDPRDAAKLLPALKREGFDSAFFPEDFPPTSSYTDPSSSRAIFYPETLRDISARFDPRLSHVSDLDYASGGPVEEREGHAGGNRVQAALEALRGGRKIFPKPQRMFPEGARPPGGEFIDAATGEAVTGQKPARAAIGITPEGKPVFLMDQQQVDVTGSPGKGSAKTMTNLYRKSAGWEWQNAPEGYENIPMIVSTKNRGQHYYSLGADYPKGVDLARYPKETSEPRLKPTTQGNVYPGDEVGTILNKKTGDTHPVYDMVTIRNLLAGTGAAGAGAMSMPDEGVAEPIEREAHAGGKRVVGQMLKAAKSEAELAAEAAKAAKEAARAKQLGRVEQYTDAPSQRINDWQWRPTTDVAKDLDLQEIPPHVQGFGDFMRDMVAKSNKEGLSDRDLIKAYTTTMSSIQRRAADTDMIREASGLPLIGAEKKIRPEGAWSEWLMSPAGQQYLDRAVKGELDQNTVDSAFSVMRKFGLAPRQIEAMDWAAKNLPGRSQAASDLVYRAGQQASPVSEWRDFTSDVVGVGPAKSGFMASLLGRGDLPTLDARQVIINTGLPTDASKSIMGRQFKGQKSFGAQEGVDRLSGRQAALGLEAPSKYDPFYQHLTHHSIWDKASNEMTTHSDIINAMRNAAIAVGVPAAGAATMPRGEQQGERQDEQFAHGGIVERALHLARGGYATPGFVDGQSSEEYSDGARPLTIYRGERPDAEPGLMDASAGSQNPFRHAPSFSYKTPPQSALDQAAQKTDGERVMSMLGIENLPQGQTYASQGPTGIERALQVIPNPANYLKRQGEAARENFDMMGQGWNDLREGNYAAGALGLGGGALGYVMSPLTGAERVLFRDPYLNATGNLRDAEAVEMVADTAIGGGLRGFANMLRGKKSMEQLAAEPWRRMRMPPPAATAVGAGAAGMTFAPDEAEAANLQKLLKPIRAYHSSPHEFSKFDLSKIGTGEGNQSFGSGLYFAENPKVSGQGGEYWMQFFNKMKPGPEFSATAALYSNKFDRDKAIAALLRGRDYHAQYGKPGNSGQGADYELGARLLAQEADEAAEMLRQGKLVGPKTYEVDIHANPDRLLNWDRPITEQSPEIRKSLSGFDIVRANNKARSSYDEALERALTTDAGTYIPPMPRDYTGKQIHSALRDQLHLTRQPPAPFLQSSADLSAQMNKRGIQGIKYLDGRSRLGEGDLTHNYVIFDDKLLDINRRYAEGGEVEGGADGGSVVDRALHLARGGYATEGGVDGQPSEEYSDGARPLTIYRGERPDAAAGAMDTRGPTSHARYQAALGQLGRFEDVPPMDPAVMGENWANAVKNYRDFPRAEGEPTMSARTPSTREQIGDFIAGDDQFNMASTIRQRLAQLAVGEGGQDGMGVGALDFVPFAGSALNATDISHQLGEGDYLGAGISAGMTALPFAGRLVKPAMDYGRRAVEVAKQYAPQAGATTVGAGAMLAPEDAQAAKIPKTPKPLALTSRSGTRALTPAANMTVDQALDIIRRTSPAVDPTADPRFWHNISSNKLTTPLDQMRAEYNATSPKFTIPVKTPSDYEGKAFISASGDPTLGGVDLVGINGQKLINPTKMQAGPGFTYGASALGPDKAVWASDLQVMSAIGNRAKKAYEAGFDPYLNYIKMGGQSPDYSHHVSDTLLDLFRQSKATSETVNKFDEKMRKGFSKDFPAFPDWPGLNSPNLEDYLYKTGPGKSRTAMAKLMATGTFQKLGMPDVSSVRFAVTEPRFLHSPNYSSGSMIARMDPFAKSIRNPAVPHKTYAAQFASHPQGADPSMFSHDVPLGIMHNEWVKEKLAKRPEINPANLQYLFTRENPTVYFTPENVDRVSRFLDLKQRGLIP